MPRSYSTTKMDSLKVGIVLCGLITIAASACPSGWMQHNARCYHFSHDKESWLNALAMCKLLNGELVEINDADESTFVSGQISSRTHYQAYIALSDVVEENVWVWMVSKAQLTQTSFTNWDTDQPNNIGGHENCVAISSNGLWHDKSCADAQYFVCEQEDTGTVSVVG